MASPNPVLIAFGTISLDHSKMFTSFSGFPEEPLSPRKKPGSVKPKQRSCAANGEQWHSNSNPSCPLWIKFQHFYLSSKIQIHQHSITYFFQRITDISVIQCPTLGVWLLNVIFKYIFTVSPHCPPLIFTGTSGQWITFTRGWCLWCLGSLKILKHCQNWHWRWKEYKRMTKIYGWKVTT